MLFGGNLTKQEQIEIVFLCDEYSLLTSKTLLSPRVMLADTLHKQVQLMTMPVSKERIQTDAGDARMETSKIAVRKWSFSRAPFS